MAIRKINNVFIAASSRNGWGGARPGAGRKPLEGRRLDVKLQVRVTNEQRAKFAALGGGVWLRAHLNELIRQDKELGISPAPAQELAEEYYAGAVAE